MLEWSRHFTTATCASHDAVILKIKFDDLISFIGIQEIYRLMSTYCRVILSLFSNSLMKQIRVGRLNSAWESYISEKEEENYNTHWIQDKKKNMIGRNKFLLNIPQTSRNQNNLSTLRLKTPQTGQLMGIDPQFSRTRLQNYSKTLKSSASFLKFSRKIFSQSRESTPMGAKR